LTSASRHCCWEASGKPSKAASAFPSQGQGGALHAATWKTAAISNVAVAFRRILGIAALVLPIQIERHWRDNAASTLRPPRAPQEITDDGGALLLVGGA